MTSDPRDIQAHQEIPSLLLGPQIPGKKKSWGQMEEGVLEVTPLGHSKWQTHANG